MTSADVKRLYASVVEDVIEGVKEAFLDEGFDENVLLELRDLWQSKMLALGTIDAGDCSSAGRYLFELNCPSVPAPPVFPNDETTLVAVVIQRENLGDSAPITIQVPARYMANNKFAEVLEMPHIVELLTSPECGAQSIQDSILTALGEPPVIEVNHEKSVSCGRILEDKKPKNDRGRGASKSRSKVKVKLSSKILEQDQTKQKRGQIARNSKRNVEDTEEKTSDEAVEKFGTPGEAVEKPETPEDASSRRGSLRKRNDIDYSIFLDGGVAEMSSDDSSSESDDLISSDDDDVIDSDPVVGTEEDEDDETPLNSGDDDPDFANFEEGQDDALILCQYDQITRSRNKWKFQLKAGIISIKGVERIFQKAIGFAEW